MEYLEDNQHFDEGALLDVVALDAGENSSNDEGNKYLEKGRDK